MILKVYLTQPTCEVPVNTQHIINGFIHATLGENNKWHDSFSDYAISSLQGGKLNPDKKTLSFIKDPYIVITSENEEFIVDVMSTFPKTTAEAFGMKYKKIEVNDFKCGPKFDKVVTICPIIVKDNNMKIAIDNPNFLNCLIKNCKDKLKHKGIEDKTFNIEIRHPERSKVKNIWVDNIFNISTMCSLVVYGKKKTRETLYNMGLGGSTGSGFGSVKLYESNCYEE